jgi:DMSO/TMAO reductase YedYZ molybdopterin-dependent catalytic subunit
MTPRPRTLGTLGPVLGLLAALILAAATPARALPVSIQFAVTGGVVNPAVYDLAALQSLPSTTQTVSFLAGGVPQTRTFVGTSLVALLDRSVIVTDPAVRNDLLTRYVTATGSDGYKAIFSLGELSPQFGDKQSLVAYGEVVNGTTVDLGNSGFARTTAPGDVRGGRYVSNLVKLDVGSGANPGMGTGSGPSTQFVVSGAVTRSETFDRQALVALPAVTRTVGTDVYTGVSLWSLLTMTVGIPVDPVINNDLLSRYVVATGSDGYQALFSLGELSPFFGNAPDIIAYDLNGAPLDQSGFARLVVPDDVRQGRFVSKLVSLEVFSVRAVPEPSAALLLLAALIAAQAVCLGGRRGLQRRC